jgi:hypothetical protein
MKFYLGVINEAVNREGVRGKEVHLHLFLISTLQLNFQVHTPVARGKSSRYPNTGPQGLGEPQSQSRHGGDDKNFRLNRECINNNLVIQPLV